MIVFKFNFEKTRQAASLILQEHHGSRMEHIRLLKLLYIVDRELLAETGRTLTGDRPVAMARGPVLSQVYDLIKGQGSPEYVAKWREAVQKDGYEVVLGEPAGIGRMTKAEVANRSRRNTLSENGNNSTIRSLSIEESKAGQKYAWGNYDQHLIKQLRSLTELGICDWSSKGSAIASISSAVTYRQKGKPSPPKHCVTRSLKMRTTFKPTNVRPARHSKGPIKRRNSALGISKPSMTTRKGYTDWNKNVGNSQPRESGMQPVTAYSYGLQLQSLPAKWQERIPTLTIADVEQDQLERDQLQARQIVDQFRQLNDEAGLLEEWERQRQDANDRLEKIPAEAHTSVSEAQAAVQAIQEQYVTSENTERELSNRNTQLSENFTRRQELTKQLREQEQNQVVHEELDRLLGREGLQRDLVRTAERAIVRSANDTVQNLSLGDLSIELDQDQEGPDKALTLCVRRAENPAAIPVNFLSGSQKFRVAVAVALAIGRYASGQARPIESVIIDEGFGSLDRDCLHAMSEEFRNLQQTQTLRRLILVSHQDEFVSRFPVGYRLEPSPTGSKVTRFHREGGVPL